MDTDNYIISTTPAAIDSLQCSSELQKLLLWQHGLQTEDYGFIETLRTRWWNTKTEDNVMEKCVYTVGYIYIYTWCGIIHNFSTGSQPSSEIKDSRGLGNSVVNLLIQLKFVVCNLGHVQTRHETSETHGEMDVFNNWNWNIFCGWRGKCQFQGLVLQFNRAVLQFRNHP